MGPQAAATSAGVLQHHGVVAVAPGQHRRRARRGWLAVAQGRRRKADDPQEVLQADEEGAFEWKGLEVSPALAAQTDDLVQMLPDPANPPESLLDDDFNNFFAGGGYSSSSSGSDYEWQAPAGSDWLMTEVYEGGQGGGGGGQIGAQGGGGPGVQGVAGAAPGPGSDFFQLRSEDWADSLVNEVGEGNSFRREQRERYGPPLLNMTNLARATEEDLLMEAEAQAMRDERIDQVMDEAMALHHHFLEHSTNRYAIAARFGELLEEIEYDDWAMPLEGDEQGLPSWCRAAFRLQHEYEALNAAAAESDELLSAAELQFTEDQVEAHLEQQVAILDQLENGLTAQQAAPVDPLEAMLRVPLPGAEDDDRLGQSLGYAADLVSKAAAAAAEDDILAVLSGEGFEEEAEEAVGAAREEGSGGEEASEEEEEEEEEEVEGGGPGASARAAAEEQQPARRRAQQPAPRKQAPAKLGRLSAAPGGGDPLLDLLGGF